MNILKTFVSILFLFVHFTLCAQRDIPVSISYYGPYAIQAGARIGASFHLKNLYQSESPKQRTLSLQPQLGYFAQSDLNRNYIIETDLVYTRRRANRSSYLAPAIGLAYLLSTENVEGRVNLGSGQITQIKEHYHHLVPMLSLEYGKVPKRYVGYFFKVFYGRKISQQLRPVTFPGVELGLKFSIKKTKSDE